MLRPLAPADLPAVLAIQESSPEAAQWSAADFERVANGEFPGWVAESSGSVVGFVVARQVAGEIEILNLAVAPEARRAGIGTRLLERALAQGSGPRRAFLEVRDSNHSAQAFYQRHGFVVSGRRKNYYSRPLEDALVLARTLTIG
jgi:ribosomal-protein-alanine N-acetyltransferase